MVLSLTLIAMADKAPIFFFPSAAWDYYDAEPIECPPDVDYFHLSDLERQLYDSFAQEGVDTYGTKMEWYTQEISKAVRDPLYDEPTTRSWAGPYILNGFVTWPSRQPNLEGDGLYNSTFIGTVWLPRKSFEDIGAKLPYEGDVVRVWNVPFFADYGSDRSTKDKKRGYYFDVTKVEADGHLYDEAGFVGFRADIKRRTDFTPERRVSPP